MMTSISKSYAQLLVTQGVFTGLAIGFLLIPAMSALTQYFSTRRAAAMGVAMAISSMGSIVIPVILNKLLNGTSIGFGWTYRIGGFIVIPFLAFALFTVKSRLPKRNSQFFLWKAFTEMKFIGCTVGMFFLFTGMFVPLVYLPIYGVERGLSEILASYLVAMLNGASIPGRIIPGIMADKLGRFNMTVAAGVTTTVLAFCWPEATSTAGIIMFTVAFGFGSGAIISSAGVLLTTCPEDQREVGAYLGQGMALASGSALIALPVVGVMLGEYGGFREISILTGCVTAAGSIVIFLTKMTTNEGLWGKV